MADEPASGKMRPVFRVLAGLMCPVFLALGVLFLPLGGIADQPWRLAAPVGALVGAYYCAKVAVTGRAPKRP